MRMVVAGGGTGGHLFPGVAVAEAVTAAGDAQVLFVGSRYGIEASAVPKTQFPFKPLAIGALRGRGLRGPLRVAAQLPVAVLQAWRILGTFRPQVVLGLGGYGSVPVVLAAWLRRIPSVLLEQNVQPGLANRLLGHVAQRVCTAFAESARFFPPQRAVQTGNPVRRLTAPAARESADFTVLAFGGSQGAHSINCAMVDAVQNLRQRVSSLHVIHQTGATDWQWVERRYREMGLAVEVVPFIDDMGDAYGRADVVICRAGATTLAELTLVGKPAILVPYPFAADDHQRTNAEVLVRKGAAECIADAELNGERLAARIEALAADRARLAAMARAAAMLAMPEATRRVVDVCRQVAAEGRKT
jgi:UDP-N-acetylglucosamine--N-acetylmuramyl-(pentapeptide) pyrophosphoryl-undecaprenol N-acetylglucosamine transferase